MSVQTQIDRISGAVQSALAALEEKGVTVPSGTTVDGLAALIAAIEAGGGGGSDIAPFKYIFTGTYTPAEDKKWVYFSELLDMPSDAGLELLCFAIHSTNGLTTASDTVVNAIRSDMYSSVQRLRYGGSSYNNNYPTKTTTSVSFNHTLQAGITYLYVILLA